MNWFYTIDDEVVGPLAEEKLIELRSGGTLGADTQVCEEGSDDWIRYEDAIKKKAPSSRTNPNQSPTPEGDSPPGTTNHLTPSDAASTSS